MPTNPAMAAARDAVFALLNLSRGFRSFVRRGGLLPRPHIGRSTLTADRRDCVVGKMLPQPVLKLGDHGRPLDSWLDCHQWLALGVGVDPRAELSPRDRAILDGLDARFLAVNSAAAAIPTVSLQCRDEAFLAWAKRHSVRGILVRPDRFIAQRLDRRSDLRSLDAFAKVADEPERAAELQPKGGFSNHMAVVAQVFN